MKHIIYILCFVAFFISANAQHNYPQGGVKGRNNHTIGLIIQYDRTMDAWYVLECDGKRISDYYEQIRPYSEGKAAALDKIMGWCFINTSGKRVTGYYAEVDTFREGHALVKDKIMGYTYIDSKGNRLVNDYFEEAYPFYRGTALVKDKIMGWYLLNKSGKRISEYHNSPHELFRLNK